MKFFYSFLILLYFLGCHTNRINSIPKEIKDQKFYNALRQVTIIAESNSINYENIGVIFSENNLYFFISESKEINLKSNYNYLQIKINNKIYKLILTQNDKIVERFIDLNKITKVSFVDNDIFEDDVRGYKFRFQRDLESNQFILERLSSYYEYDNNFILKEDEKYFPNIKIILPEPEPEPPVDEFK